jgi:DNA-binding HxlR family transcriptional regulator
MPQQTMLVFMGTGIYKAELLEDRHMIRVILMLRSKGPLARVEFYDMVAKGMTTTFNRVNELIRVGLIEEHVMDRRPFVKTIKLTAKGQEIAEHLEAIEVVLGSMEAPSLFKEKSEFSIPMPAKEIK